MDSLSKSGSEITKAGGSAVEMSTDVLSAGLTAEVQARYMLANRFPRNWDDCRLAILRDCERPRFAMAAKYRKPVGKALVDGQWTMQYAVGPSIRFAESVLRALRNWDCTVMDVFDDDNQVIARVSLVDLENNSRSSIDVTVQKTVERKTLKKGQVPLSKRLNSYGDEVFLVQASSDDVLVKKAALVSKAKRNLVIQCVPSDILEDAMEMVDKAVSEANAKADPDVARKAVLDAFGGIGIKPSDIEQYLQHSTENILPKELNELRGIFTAIRDGEIKWKDVVDMNKESEGEVDEKAEKKRAQSRRVIDDAMERSRAKAAQREPGQEG